MVALEQVQTSSVIIGTGASAKGNNRVHVLVMAPAPVIYDVRGVLFGGDAAASRGEPHYL